MAEYIEREAVRNLKHYFAGYGLGDVVRVKDIEAIPAADVAPVVHGRWVQVVCHVEFEDGFVDRLYECCSVCHENNGRKTSFYCPNCGAKMDGE